ncbi:MAG: hypothetical protein FWC61_01265 [Proteobacteria bacterium]|nr:hypothetical protein [Pseudomonadota bacterium]
MSIGATYADIKAEADRLKQQAKSKKLDDIGNALFGSRLPIVSDMPSLQSKEPIPQALKTTAIIAETAVQYTGKLTFAIIKKMMKNK